MNRKYSLKKSRDIEKLVRLKKSVGNKQYAIYYSTSTEDNPKIAISISKKLGDAVTRNYQKRVVREIIRPNIDKLNGYNLLIVIKQEAKDLTFEEKRNYINYLLRKIINRSWK